MGSVNADGRVSGMTGQLHVPANKDDSNYVLVEMWIDGTSIAGGRIPVKQLVRVLDERPHIFPSTEKYQWASKICAFHGPGCTFRVAT